MLYSCSTNINTMFTWQPQVSFGPLYDWCITTLQYIFCLKSLVLNLYHDSFSILAILYIKLALYLNAYVHIGPLIRVSTCYIQGPISFSSSEAASERPITLKMLRRSVTAVGSLCLASHRSKIFSVGLAFVAKQFMYLVKIISSQLQNQWKQQSYANMNLKQIMNSYVHSVQL